jgi:hypothetical protein
MGNKKLETLLPSFMRRLGESQKQRPDLVLAAWPILVGEKIAQMARVQSFEEGILTIKVTNSSLLSLLVQNERPRLLKELRKQFPCTRIYDIRFRMG